MALPPGARGAPTSYGYGNFHRPEFIFYMKMERTIIVKLVADHKPEILVAV